jgi:hypothetical protein
MINEPLTEYLPQVRCTATLKRRLELVAADSITSNLADHIRHAVEQYVASAESGSQPTAAQPATQPA